MSESQELINARIREEIARAKKEEFDHAYAVKLVEKIVFRGIAIILTAVLVAILALIIKSK